MFKTWLKSTRVTDDPVGDFIADAQDDHDFPNIQAMETLERYLSFKHACGECLEIVPEIWERYQNERQGERNGVRLVRRAVSGGTR